MAGSGLRLSVLVGVGCAGIEVVVSAGGCEPMVCWEGGCKVGDGCAG